MISRLGILAVLVAVALPAGAGARGAGPPASVDAIVKIRNSAPAFHGRVVAENGSCNGPRPVKMFERRRNGAKLLLGRTTSDLDGHWQVLVDPLASGSYFAVAPEAERNDGGVEFVCERAKSRTLVVN